MRFVRETVEIEGGRKLYLYTFPDGSRANERQAKFWTAVSEGWRERGGQVESWFAPVTEAILDGLASCHGRLLDVGCGAQTMVYPQQWDIVGVDIARAIINPSKRAAVAASDVLPFADDSFDGVVSRMALMLAADPAKAFREIGRVLKPGGRLSFAVWASGESNRWATAAQEVLDRYLDLRPASAYEPHGFRLADVGEVRSMLEAARLEPAPPKEIAVPYLADLDSESALERLIAFVGPLRLSVDRIEASDREKALEELSGAISSANRSGVAWVWTAMA
ncbi:MAG: class I SAM-dependent methyltransferase [Fimbriimonadales bacterium]